MTAISFYLFEKSVERQVQSACRLARKVLKTTPKLWWYCPSKELQHTLDDLLWSFDPTSFITHGIDETTGQVCISGNLPTEGEWIIFNFSDDVIDVKDTFKHIIEIVENTEASKITGRDKFKQYRQLGIEPRTFKL
ncbi:DNA polymerase III subunit chi [Acinetobacter pollinis]|uniref:DNA polymerase III subunit chi n=1 Tax=Acinetobacter pollinis TaxID=2605270 RepID=UPI0018A31114|nr:DNA polymerase III subunit chi [Acinetobacter pollinis]MBF7690036.1 DNA polymerase III subunit chi [Acinetobacter pollinis]MBF7692771.1 DNA polymerase III subunit chi [Acinetobacter pollinis]MBF7697760.1 DNA polymerase III subunit chi [Acinetobacter pollinis]MBF7700750.1 DNA polymerase III subunit chi [Acinetobacter pollinis]